MLVLLRAILTEADLCDNHMIAHRNVRLPTGISLPQDGLRWERKWAGPPRGSPHHAALLSELASFCKFNVRLHPDLRLAAASSHDGRQVAA
jgi:hypothetical protein